MCTATLGATPVYLWTCAASSIFSVTVRGTPGWANTLNRVPVFPNAHDGVSIRCARNAVFTAVRSGITTHLQASRTGWACPWIRAAGWRSTGCALSRGGRSRLSGGTPHRGAGHRCRRRTEPSRLASARSRRPAPSAVVPRRSRRSPGNRSGGRRRRGKGCSWPSPPRAARRSSPARPHGARSGGGGREARGAGKQSTPPAGPAGPGRGSRRAASGQLPLADGWRDGTGAVPPAVELEVVVIDVGRAEHQRRAEDDRAVRAYGELTELARGEGLPRHVGDLLGGKVDRRVGGQVAEVGRVPELELRRYAVGHVLLHRVGRAKPGHDDLALVLGRGHHLGGGYDAHRGRRDDALDVRVTLQQSLGHLRRGGRVVVPVDDAHQVDLRELRQFLLHVADPGVLVRGRGGGGDDPDVPAVMDLFGHEVHQAVPDRLAGRL